MIAFLDTNILIYAQQDGQKAETARQIVEVGGAVSVQVLNEFVAIARRKLQRDWPAIDHTLRLLRDTLSPILPLTLATHEAALRLVRDHSFSIYDALIVSSATEAGCDTLLTEDMQHGRSIGLLTIRNPFL